MNNLFHIKDVDINSFTSALTILSNMLKNRKDIYSLQYIISDENQEKSIKTIYQIEDQ